MKWNPPGKYSKISSKLDSKLNTVRSCPSRETKIEHKMRLWLKQELLAYLVFPKSFSGANNLFPSTTDTLMGWGWHVFGVAVVLVWLMSREGQNLEGVIHQSSRHPWNDMGSKQILPFHKLHGETQNLSTRTSLKKTHLPWPFYRCIYHT